jgi:metal-responsive CopG/Arc/MetJ family transcriptional regulator
MASKQQSAASTVTSATTRLSVSFPSELYQTLEQIAQQQKVSVAWVVRDAADKYVSDRWPLLAPKG